MISEARPTDLDGVVGVVTTEYLLDSRILVMGVRTGVSVRHVFTVTFPLRKVTLSVL